LTFFFLLFSFATLASLEIVLYIAERRNGVRYKTKSRLRL